MSAAGGTVFTFYSYKGGVGRSMALANVAEVLLGKGYTTLVVDWDLEAPGIERYFQERYCLDLEEVVDREGLCCMIDACMQRLAQPADDSRESDGSRHDDDGDEAPAYPPVERYLFEVAERNGARLLLMPAGRRTPGEPWARYVDFVQTFDWAAFYRDWEGGHYLDWLLERLRQLADVILIDSRTGVTEMGGVATQHLADCVLLFTGANLENVDNTARMARSFTSQAVREARRGRSLEIMIVPSRIDDADSEGFSEYLERSRAAFDDLTTWDDQARYGRDDLCLPYLAHCSYREVLVVGHPELASPAKRLVEAYHRIATNMRLLADPDGTLQQRHTAPDEEPVLLAFARGDRRLAQAIAAFLEKHEITCLLLDVKERTVDDPVRDILRASHVILLLSPVSSRADRMRKVIATAIDASKPVIPVRLGDVELPFELASIQAVAMRSERDRKTPRQILRAIRPEPEPEPERPRSRLQIYLSYCDEDREAIERIKESLAVEGFDVWDPAQRVLPGQELRRASERVIMASDVMLAAVSTAAQESRWTRAEAELMQRRGGALLLLIVGPLDRPLDPFLNHHQSVNLARDFDAGIERLVGMLRHHEARVER